MEITSNIREILTDMGACREHLNKVSYSTPAEVLSHYVSMPEWCFEHNFPDVEFLKNNFSIEDLNANGIYVEQNMDNVVLSNYIIITHKCTGHIQTSKFDVLRVYLASDNDICFDVNDRSVLIIDAYYNNIVDVIKNGSAKCIIYSYGNNDIRTDETVNINNKGGDKQ